MNTFKLSEATSLTIDVGKIKIPTNDNFTTLEVVKIAGVSKDFVYRTTKSGLIIPNSDPNDVGKPLVWSRLQLKKLIISKHLSSFRMTKKQQHKIIKEIK